MTTTPDSSNTEVLLAASERHRRLLRRACWIGIVFTVAAILFVFGHPFYVRWQLRQHGWTFDTTSRRMLPDWAPEWLDPWLGRYEFAHLQSSKLRLSDLESLRRIQPNLGWVTFESTKLSETEFAAISKLSDLWAVDFTACQIDANALRHLGTLPQLSRLYFVDTVLEADALETLSICHRLEWLRLTGITNADLQPLSRLPRLKGLELYRCRLTDEGAKRLTDDFPNLEVLVLRNVPLTDAALGEFARHSRLNSLSLIDIPVTNDGLLKLRTCSSLKDIHIKNGKVTQDGASELRTILPGLAVTIE